MMFVSNPFHVVGNGLGENLLMVSVSTGMRELSCHEKVSSN